MAINNRVLLIEGLKLIISLARSSGPGPTQRVLEEMEKTHPRFSAVSEPATERGGPEVGRQESHRLEPVGPTPTLAKTEHSGTSQISAARASGKVSGKGFTVSLDETRLETGPQGVSEAFKMPTTAETVEELQRRLGKELYRMELDLISGGRIAGRACDCLGKKHILGIEATAEELMSYEKEPVYSEIITWLRSHEAEFDPSEIAKREPNYYRGLAPEVRNFRKQVMGSSGDRTPKLASEMANTPPMRQRAGLLPTTVFSQTQKDYRDHAH